MEPSSSLLHSQVPAICPYPEPARSSTHPHIPLPEVPPQSPPIYAWVSQVVSYPQVSPPKPCISLHPSSTISATCPGDLVLLHFITRTIFGEQYRSLSSSLCNFLHSPVTSSLLGPNILFSNLFSNTLSLRYSLNVSDHVSYPRKTTHKIIGNFILGRLLLNPVNKIQARLKSRIKYREIYVRQFIWISTGHFTPPTAGFVLCRLRSSAVGCMENGQMTARAKVHSNGRSKQKGTRGCSSPQQFQQSAETGIKEFIYKGGTYIWPTICDKSQYFIVIIALHVSGDHCPSSGARNCMCSRTVYRLCGSLFGRLYSNHGVMVVVQYLCVVACGSEFRWSGAEMCSGVY
jgi:hypothetical protein